MQLGPVVRGPISANPGSNFNLGSFFFCSKAFSQIICTILLEHPIIKLQAKRIQLNLLSKLSYLNSNFALTPGYLNPALNNPFVRSIRSIRHTYLFKYRTRKEKKLEGNTRKGSSGCLFRLWRFLADQRSGLAIYRVLSLRSLVGFTIMYYFISSEILACSA